MANDLVYLRGVIHNTPKDTVDERKSGKDQLYIVRPVNGGLVDLYRLGTKPLYDGQHPFIVRASETLEAGY